MSASVLTRAVQEWKTHDPKCHAGLDADEIERTVASGLCAGTEQPRSSALNASPAAGTHPCTSCRGNDTHSERGASLAHTIKTFSRRQGSRARACRVVDTPASRTSNVRGPAPNAPGDKLGDNNSTSLNYSNKKHMIAISGGGGVRPPYFTTL